MTADLGPQYPRDNPYQASQRLWQSNWRCIYTSAGYEGYGNMLDEQSARKGLNFISSEIFDAVRKRAESGKGIDYERITKNLLTSQALCFNYFVPLQADPGLASCVLRQLFPFVDECREIVIEYTPPNILNDQGVRHGVDADVAIRFQHTDSRPGILLIEIKYTEPAFSRCSHGKSCPAGRSSGSTIDHCLYTRKNRYRYWEYTRPDLFRVADIRAQPICPFRGVLKQLWTNQVLAEAVREHEGLAHSDFAVIYPEGNHALRTEHSSDVFEDYQSLLTSPGKFTPVTWRSIHDATSRCVTATGHRAWFDSLCERYRGLFHPEIIRELERKEK